MDEQTLARVLDAERGAETLREDFVRRDLVDQTSGKDGPVLQEQEMGRGGWKLFDVMSHGDARQARTRKNYIVQCAEEHLPAAEVESSGRLVEN